MASSGGKKELRRGGGGGKEGGGGGGGGGAKLQGMYKNIHPLLFLLTGLLFLYFLVGSAITTRKNLRRSPFLAFFSSEIGQFCST